MAEARILVVEDQAMVATALESLLVSFGYVVPAILAYGEEVLGQVDRLQPDLILMDISLQGAMDGVQAAQEVRTRYDLPIIYLTARSDTRTLERANITEPYGYILKPFEGRELQLTIEMALHKYRLERQIAESEELRAAAALSERQRIARDLHDTVSQTLLSAQMISSTLLRSRERDSDDFNGRLRTLDQMIHAAVNEMRVLLVELRPNALENVTLHTLLNRMVAAAAGQTSARVRLSVAGDLEPPEPIRVAAYRVAQESVNNAVRHASAQEVVVTLETQAEALYLRVADDGRGIEPGRPHEDNFGLAIMRERAQAIGAVLTIDSGPNLGTRVSLKWAPSETSPAA